MTGVNAFHGTDGVDQSLAGIFQIGAIGDTDFNHNPKSSIFDATETRVNGRLVKVMSWYDNEWGFSNRMLDNTVELMKHV